MGCGNGTIEVITFGAKALRLGLGLAPVSATPVLNRQRLACLDIQDEPSKDSPAYKRYRRMEQAWRSLAEEQEWLDGEVPPLGTDHADVSTRPPG